MDRQTINKMLQESPVAKNLRILTCGCGKIVKVSKYQGTIPYKCDDCRHPKEKNETKRS